MFLVCPLLIFEGWFGGLSLWDLETKDLQHTLGCIMFGNVLLCARSFGSVFFPTFTCIIKSLQLGRPHLVGRRYNNSFSFFTCWIWASLLMGFIPWPYSWVLCNWGTINVETMGHVSHRKDLANSESGTWQLILVCWYCRCSKKRKKSRNHLKKYIQAFEYVQGKNPRIPVTSWWPPSMPINPYPLTSKDWFQDTLSGKRKLQKNTPTFICIEC